MKTIDYKTFIDKVHGCWYGKCLGGAAGAPVEGVKKLIPVKDFTEIFNPDLPNDDLDIQLLWLDVLENKGTIINSCDLADAWMEKCWYPFSEYGYFTKNYMRGVKPPYTGIINNDFFQEGMGCPIRSEIWGIISAGNPELAAQYAYIDATLDHAENSVYAEQFLAAIESMAFFESDIETLLREGMKYIPKDCKLSTCFNLILENYQKMSWQDLRTMVLNRFSHPDFTNVVQNLAFVFLSLLYGKGDMRETINISLQCGFDTDCTCASAASVVGIIKGYEGLGEELTTLIQDYFVIGVDVVRPSNSIRQLAEDTARLALKTPNFEVEFIGAEADRPQGKLELVYPTEQGLKEAFASLKPLCWEIYGPYFDQLDQPINPDFPSPHGEGCVLPDIVCMVNNEVFLDRDYPLGELAGVVKAYEDKIDVDSCLSLEGQIACVAKTKIYAKEEKQVWAVIGNNDGFRLWCNGEMLLEKDEIRYWTPYNNFTLLPLKKGENEITLKLLRRTEKLNFTIGFRIYDGGHWHRSRWCTNQKDDDKYYV